MPRFNIEIFLNSLPETTTKIDVSNKRLIYLPDISRFIYLESLCCDDNYLISLPALPESLIYLSCLRNKLRSLPEIPRDLQFLYCSYNELTSLPILPESLLHLYADSNKITSLSAIPQNLRHLYLTKNMLTSLPEFPPDLRYLYVAHNNLTCIHDLPESVTGFSFCFNPIWKIINHNDLTIIKQRIQIINPIWEIINHNDLTIIKQRIQIINSFRYLYYCLKFKRQFRKWLWERVRKPKIEQKYNPKFLIENLNENMDLDRFLHYWVNYI